MVLVGPIPCGRLVLGHGAKVLNRVAQGFVHDIKEDEVDGQKEEQGDHREEDEEEKEVEMSRQSERHNAHET